MSDFFAAAISGDEFLVEAYIEKGENVNSKNSEHDTVLFLAALKGHSKVVLMLLKAGANPELEGRTGTPLFIASARGHTEVVRNLLEFNANKNTKGTNSQDGRMYTPLEIAKLRNHQSVVSLLSEPYFSMFNGFTQVSSQPTQTENQEISTLFKINEKLEDCGVNLIAINRIVKEMDPEIQKCMDVIEENVENCTKNLKEKETIMRCLEESFKQDFEKEINLTAKCALLEEELTKAKGELKQLRSEMPEMLTSLNTARSVFEKANESLLEASSVESKSSGLIQRIMKKTLESETFCKEWEEKVKQGDISTWQQSDLRHFLQELDLESWYSPINMKDISPQQLIAMSESELQGLENQGTKMLFSEARLITLSFQSVQNKRGIIRVFNDKNLDPINVSRWTSENLADFLRSKNFNAAAKLFQQKKINGPVFISLTENELSDFGIVDSAANAPLRSLLNALKAKGFY